MNNMNCVQCGAPLEAGADRCKYCGEAINFNPQGNTAGNYQQANNNNNYQQQNNTYQQQPNMNMPAGINPAWPIKSKIAAGILAIFLGGLGIHKFYLGKTGKGILYLVFCWTYIPSLIAFIEGIIYLCSNDYNFQVKNQVRTQ